MMRRFYALTAALALGISALAATPSQRDSLVAAALEYRDAPSDSLRAAFNERFLRVRPGTSLSAKPHPLFPDSTFYGGGSLDENLLPLAFGMVDDSVREEVVKNVITTIRRQHFSPKLSALAEPLLLPVLAENGWNKWAWFICDKHPEMVTDTCIAPEYVRQWKERYVAGISVLPAQKHRRQRVALKPDFSIEELDSLSWRAETPYGPVSSRFVKDLMHAEWWFELPKGVKAEVTVPTAKRSKVRLRCLGWRLSKGEHSSKWLLRGGSHHISVDFDLPAHVVEKQFVYTDAEFPQCHSATLCFTEGGDLLCAFNGGTAEHEADTRVRLSRKAKGSGEWTPPVAVAAPDSSNWCLDNPVLFRIPESGSPLLLYYKIRPAYKVKEGEIDLSTIAFWQARLKKSYDDGASWSEAEALPEGFLGPIKNKPVWHEGRIIAGSSTQSKYAHIPSRIHFEWSDDRGQTWHKSEPCDVELSIDCKQRKKGKAGTNVDVPADPNRFYGNYHPISSIQPTILIHKDGTLQALSRTGNGKMSVTFSHDNGSAWSKETLTSMPQNGAGIDAITLPDGRFALVYNDFETLPGRSGGSRSPLKVAISDDGDLWTDLVTLEDDAIKEYSYPAVICDGQGYLHIAYTWRRYRIKYVRVKP